VKQAPAGYCICEKQHRAGSNQNRANTTWWNSPLDIDNRDVIINKNFFGNTGFVMSCG